MRGILSLSGGMDSGTLLAYLLDRKMEVRPVLFAYPSKHNSYELECAKKLCRHYNVAPWVVNLTEVLSHMKSNLLKHGGPIPEGHYEEKSMSQTVVPGRNLIFASVLAGLAMSDGYDTIYLGVHSGDHAIYPDCRPPFIYHLNLTIQMATDSKVSAVAPFIDWNKTKIIEEGLRLNFPYQLTRTCYKDQFESCGRCGSCTERLEAFANNDATDPIPYTQYVIEE